MTKEQKPYFPMFVDLSEKQVVVVGAGTIAKRRIRTLTEFTNHLIVIAPEVNNELLEMEKEGLLTLKRKKYERTDIYDADMVIAASNDHAVNNDIYSACKCMGILVNVCSDKNKCDFYFPGIVKHNHVIVGVSSGGRDQKTARKIIEQIKKLFLFEISDAGVLFYIPRAHDSHSYSDIPGW